VDFSDLNFELILTELPDSPCGQDMRYENEYDILRRARQQDDTAGLAQGVWEKDIKQTDWDSVVKQSYGLLIERTKDVQVAAWLVEGLVHSYGIRGLVVGIDVFVNMVIKFWDGVFPVPEDESDMPVRIQAINWLIRELLKLFKVTPDVLLIGKIGGEEGKRSLEKIVSDLGRLSQFLDEKAGDDAPVFRELLAAVSEFSRVSFLSLSPVNGGGDSLSSTSSNLGISDGLSGGQGLGNVGYDRTLLDSRDAAYEQLAAVANYLSKIEPHSPVSMILQTIVSWKGLSFSELLAHLPNDGKSVYDLLQIFRPESTEL
jgi:type VI secretion system protein ImpA